MTVTDAVLTILVFCMIWLIYEVRKTYSAVAPLLASRIVQALERL